MKASCSKELRKEDQLLLLHFEINIVYRLTRYLRRLCPTSFVECISIVGVVGYHSDILFEIRTINPWVVEELP